MPDLSDEFKPYFSEEPLPPSVTMMLPGPEKRECPCGCGQYGVIRRKTGHVRSCTARCCEAGRHRARAAIRERKVARDTRGETAARSGQDSGYDGRTPAVFLHWEETSNVSIVRGVRRWWESKGVQTKLARLMAMHGINRALVCSWSDVPGEKAKPKIVVMPYEDWAALVREESRD